MTGQSGIPTHTLKELGTPPEESRDSQRLEKLVQQIAQKDAELYQLIELILKSENSTKDKQTLIHEIRKFKPAIEDRFLFKTVVLALAAIGAVTTVFAGILAFNGKEPTAALIGIGSTAIGAIAGVLNTSKE